MNNKKVSVVAALLFAALVASAQTITIVPGQDTSDYFKKASTISLDKSTMKVSYRFEVLHDTITPDAIKSDNIMVLQIGEKNDKYFDQFRAMMHEFLTSEENKKKDPNAVLNEGIQIGKGSLTDVIYWNYPTKGELTVTTHMLGDHWLYKEAIPKIAWQMEEGNRTVAGYACQKATCHLYGRNYMAWYAPEIPISKGPYKFSGLPGLILQIEDDRQQVSWTCIGLEKQAEEIFFTEQEYIKTDKARFLKSFNNFKRDPLTHYQSAGKVTPTSGKPQKTFHYNPIEEE